MGGALSLVWFWSGLCGVGPMLSCGMLLFLSLPQPGQAAPWFHLLCLAVNPSSALS